MAFSCAYMLSRFQNDIVEAHCTNTEQDISKTTKSLKRQCPFPSSPAKESANEVLPEAVDVLNSIFTTLCTSTGTSSVLDENVNLNPELIDLCELSNEGKDLLSYITEKTLEGDLLCQIEEGAGETYFDYNLDFTCIPQQINGIWKEFNSDTKNNYTRGCKWAPDGSCIMSCSDDNYLRLFNLPAEVCDPTKWENIPEMEAVVKIKEGELIYDYCWYPHMSSTNPATCCFASSSKNNPVHLWDAFTGELRCTYRAYDQMDEIAPALSLSFDADGSRIFCGYNKAIRVFNVDTPGRHFEERKTFAKKSGQSGIISCFGFTPANRSVLAAGSYNKSIGIYSEPNGELQCILEGQKGGVTQLQFSPDGNLLYSGGRKDPEILCWDMRNLGSVLYCLRRSCKTNQRMQFDISRNGRYIISGNHNGAITIWDTLKEPEDLINAEFSVLLPIQFYLAHHDCVNGLSIHPTAPLMCSSSGQRLFPTLLPDDEDEIFSKDIPIKDNSLRLWWIGKSIEEQTLPSEAPLLGKFEIPDIF